MFTDVRKHKAATLLRVVDAATAKEIPDVVWADDLKGEYGRYKKDAAGKHVFTKRGGSLELETVKRAIRLEFRE